MEPVAVVTSYLPVRVFAGIEKQDPEKQSLYHVFQHTYKPKLHWAEETIGSTVAAQEESRILGPNSGSALLVIKETTHET